MQSKGCEEVDPIALPSLNNDGGSSGGYESGAPCSISSIYPATKREYRLINSYDGGDTTWIKGPCIRCDHDGSRESMGHQLLVPSSRPAGKIDIPFSAYRRVIVGNTENSV